MKETIIISLGGSIVNPNLPDPDFLNTFKALILEEIKNGKRFVIIVGGGKTCRNYQDALSKTITASTTDLDWIGIYATHLNAQLVRMSFGDVAANEIVIDPSVLQTFSKAVIVGAGWKPGWSTDYDAVMMAKQVGAKKIINLSNIEYVYDKDPKKYDDARKITESSWADFRVLLPKEWISGLNSPFDPIAAQEAESLGIEVAIMNGRNIENLKKYLDGEKFIGTIIK
jgi:uridylate kinase